MRRQGKRAGGPIVPDTGRWTMARGCPYSAKQRLEQSACRNQQPVERTQDRSVRHDSRAHLACFLSHAPAALHHQLQFERGEPTSLARLLRQPIRQAGAVLHQSVGMRQQGLQQGCLRLPAGDLRLAWINTQGFAQRRREVVALAWNIDRKILPEIVVLQGGADGVALLEAGGIIHSVQMQHQTADRVGRMTCIVGQFVPVGVHMAVASVVYVALEGGDQIMQGQQGQGMAHNGGPQRLHHVCPRPILRGILCIGSLQRPAVVLQGYQSLIGRKLALVGQVIGRARKSVKRHHGGSDGGRAQPAGYGKILVVCVRVVVVVGGGSVVCRQGAHTDQLRVEAGRAADRGPVCPVFSFRIQCYLFSTADIWGRAAAGKHSHFRAGGEIGRRTRFRS